MQNINNKLEDVSTKDEHKRPAPGLPLVSIVTVVFNGEKHLEQTIQSVLSQSYTNVEYIIIDGGSTDGTLEIIQHHAAAGHVTRFVSEPDDGIADAFNKGIAIANGNVIGLLNADDCYIPGVMAKVSAACQRLGPEVIVHGNMLTEAGSRRKRVRPRPFPRLWKYVDFPFNHPTMFVPSSIYARIGKYSTDYRYAMDYDFFLRAMLAGVKFYHLDEDVAVFSLAGESTSNARECHREVLRSQLANGLSVPICRLTYCLKMAINRVKKLI